MTEFQVLALILIFMATTVLLIIKTWYYLTET